MVQFLPCLADVVCLCDHTARWANPYAYAAILVSAIRYLPTVLALARLYASVKEHDHAVELLNQLDEQLAARAIALPENKGDQVSNIDDQGDACPSLLLRHVLCKRCC